MNDNTGGQAFQVASTHVYHVKGMTLRDYFAAKVIASMFADRQACLFSRKDLDTFATCAYEMADAMLKARGEQP